MIEQQDAKDIAHASLYYHELFKKTVFSNNLPNINGKTQMDLLVTLSLNGPMSMSTLSERAGIAPEQTTRAIRHLRELGYVHSDRSDENRRIVIARITEEGLRAMAQHEHQIRASLEAGLNGLNDEEIAQLAEISRQASALLRKTTFKRVVPE